MGNDPPKHSRHDVQALGPELLDANDHKIRRVLAVVDDVADPAINRALLDGLRPRLATLRPVRPLRFARLLFTPLDRLTVPLRGWHLGHPTVPRTILAPIARIVRAGLGDLASVIDKIIAGRKGDATQAITEAGEILWPRAAAILATAAPPADWPETGLPLAAYRPLAASVAAVLRRAPRLRRLALDEDYGALAPDDDTAADILANIANESETGCAMIARLILARSPHSARLLGRIAGAGRTADEKTVLRRAMDRGMDAELCHLERDTGFVHEIAHGGLADMGQEVRRATTLLREIEGDRTYSDHWPRLKAIRDKLDDVCRTRFARGLHEGLVVSLATASGPVAAAAQSELETCARDLRKLEMAARQAGGSINYDGLLRQASDAVLTAAAAGTLTRMRTYRLIEILAGPEAAAALYNEAAGGP